ncbi:MAG: hypothetical protein LC796_07840 [Acidobacteria bacterium]|nr:hypothetical protein [Acidobacteriota bacterium]
MEDGAAMRPGHLWIATLLLLPMAGAPLLAHPAFASLTRVSRVALSAAVGAVLVSTAMTLAALVSIPWNVPGVAAAAAVAAALLRFALKADPADERTPESVSGDPGAAGAVPRAFPLLCALSAAAAVAIALDASATGAAASVDLVLFWGPKAQAFAAARTIDRAFLAAPALEYMNRSYPPLVTNLGAFATMTAGRFPWGAAVMMFPLLLALLTLGLPGLLRRAGSGSAGSAASALSVAALAYLGIRFEVGGNGDMPLWLFEALAAASLAGPLGRDGSMPLLSGLLLAGAATSKVEGLPFAAAALALFFAARWRQLNARRVLLLVAPPAIALGSWFWFGASRGLFTGYRGFGRLFDVQVERLPAILSTLGAVLRSSAGGLPFLLPLLFVLIAAPRLRAAAVPAGTAAALVLFFVFTYLHGGLDPKEWILWTAGRIFAPVGFLLAIAGASGHESPSNFPHSRPSRR